MPLTIAAWQQKGAAQEAKGDAQQAKGHAKDAVKSIIDKT